MGNFLQRLPTAPIEKDLLNQLQKKKLDDVLECGVVINDSYPDLHSVNYTQFDDIFTSLVDDTEPFFLQLQNDHDLEGQVDIYESLAAFSIFCGDKFETKVSLIFKLFDFDRNESLELSELVLTLQSAIRGLCKFVNIEPPTLQILEDTAKSIFTLIDHDHNHRITFDEFTYWITHSHELQDFLLRYANTQTFDNLKRRFDQIYTVLRHLFNNAAGGADQQFAEESPLQKLLEEEAKSYLKTQDIEFLMKILVQSSGGDPGAKIPNVVSRKVFEPVIKAWASYSASDINGDNSINISELKNLIWIYENEEPSELRLKNEMKELDKDGSNAIDRYEWIKHFCSEDRNGVRVFRASLRQLFEKYDKDNSGALSLDELRELMREAFKNYLERAKDEDTKKNLNEMIDEVASEVLKDLDAEGDKAIQWEEFKHYMEAGIANQEKLKNFLDMNM